MTENKVEVDHQKGVVESGANEVVEIQENENRILETESGWVKQEPRKAAKKVRRQANKLQRDALVNGEESVGDSLVSVGDSLMIEHRQRLIKLHPHFPALSLLIGPQILNLIEPRLNLLRRAL